MMSYNYETGQITRDFVLKKTERDCNVEPDRTRLIGVMCQTCPYYQKMKTFYHPSRDAYRFGSDEIGTFVFCKYHKRDDDEAQDILDRMYEQFKEEALIHFYD